MLVFFSLLLVACAPLWALARVADWLTAGGPDDAG